MIRSRRELEAVAAQWTARAKEDLRNQMIAFIEANGTNEGELADALAISVDEIDQILNGNGEISLSTFAKILIATDNVIEIKPVSVMQRQIGGRMPMPQRGQTPQPRDSRGRFASARPQGMEGMPPMGEGFPMPPIGEGFPMPPMGEIPPRFGGMPGMQKRKPMQEQRQTNDRHTSTPRQGAMQRVRLDEIELDELGKNELLEIIRQNHWDSEIHSNAKRGELIEFLNWKINTPEPENVGNCVEPREETENERIGRMLAEEVARNPHLKEMVKKYL